MSDSVWFTWLLGRTEGAEAVFLNRDRKLRRGSGAHLELGVVITLQASNNLTDNKSVNWEYSQAKLCSRSPVWRGTNEERGEEGETAGSCYTFNLTLISYQIVWVGRGSTVSNSRWSLEEEGNECVGAQHIPVLYLCGCYVWWLSLKQPASSPGSCFMPEPMSLQLTR